MYLKIPNWMLCILQCAGDYYKSRYWGDFQLHPGNRYPFVENSGNHLKMPDWVFCFIHWLCNGQHCYFGNYDGYILREIGPVDIVLGHVIPKLAGYTRYTFSIEWRRHDLIKIRMITEEEQ